MYQLSAKLAQKYQVTALVVGLSVWKLSCTIWSCRLYTVKSVKYTIPYIYLHLSLLGGLCPTPPGVLHRALTGGVQPPTPTILTLRISNLNELKQRLRTEWAKLDHVIVAAIRHWRLRRQEGCTLYIYTLLLPQILMTGSSRRLQCTNIPTNPLNHPHHPPPNKNLSSCPHGCTYNLPSP